MIYNKQDLKRYLEMDAKALGVNPKKLYFFRKGVWNF